jgi:hypothetical protein
VTESKREELKPYTQGEGNLAHNNRRKTLINAI